MGLVQQNKLFTYLLVLVALMFIASNSSVEGKRLSFGNVIKKMLPKKKRAHYIPAQPVRPHEATNFQTHAPSNYGNRPLQVSSSNAVDVLNAATNVVNTIHGIIKRKKEPEKKPERTIIVYPGTVYAGYPSQPGYGPNQYPSPFPPNQPVLVDNSALASGAPPPMSPLAPLPGVHSRQLRPKHASSGAEGQMSGAGFWASTMLIFIAGYCLH